MDELCKRCGFEELINKKKAETISMVRYIIRTYEVFYGERFAPPVDVVKRVLKVFLELSPPSVNLSITNREMYSQVLDRVVERIYRAAEAELVKDGTIKYIS